MKVLNILFLMVFIMACNSNNENVESADSKLAGQAKSKALNCYRYATISDTIVLKLIHIGDAITGNLVYNLKEKDRNMGTIRGAIRDSILVADYTFMSEGIQSVRQVAFKLEGSSFTEGYGDSYDSNGKTVFRNLDSLDYSSRIQLTEIACQ